MPEQMLHEDAAGNGNEASTHTVAIDLTRPGVTLTAPTTPQNAAFDVSIEFTEVVTGFSASEISLSGVDATVTNFVGDDGDSEYTAEITPTTEGELVIQVPAGAAEDAATNGNAASPSRTVAIDRTRPSVTLMPPTTPQNADTFDVSIEFTEVVTGFSASEISLSGVDATVTNFVGDDGDSEYTAEITPTTEGELVIQVPAGAAEDAATNGNAASSPRTVTIDRTRPEVTVSETNDPQNAAFDVTITFDEAVTGFEASDIDLTTGTATATVTNFAEVMSARSVNTPPRSHPLLKAV